MIGLPFLIFIVFMRREYRYDLMMVDSNKFDSLNQAVSQILYLTRCLNYYSKAAQVLSFTSMTPPPPQTATGTWQRSWTVSWTTIERSATATTVLAKRRT